MSKPETHGEAGDFAPHKSGAQPSEVSNCQPAKAHAAAAPGAVPLTVGGARTGGISRREAVQWVMAAVAASALPWPASRASGQPVGRTVAPQEHAATQPNPGPNGYGVDPKLVAPYKPGDLWPLTFNDAQRAAATALADVILPKDALGPAASAVGVPAMVDEWISAPYPQQQADRPVVLEGLAWIDAESTKRFGKGFSAISIDQQHAICDDICDHRSAKAEFHKGAGFFSRFRSICAGAYYGTPEGWKAIGYVGNVALPKFDGPAEEVLKKLGVTQTVRDE